MPTQDNLKIKEERLFILERLDYIWQRTPSSLLKTQRQAGLRSSTGKYPAHLTIFSNQLSAKERRIGIEGVHAHLFKLQDEGIVKIFYNGISESFLTGRQRYYGLSIDGRAVLREIKNLSKIVKKKDTDRQVTEKPSSYITQNSEGDYLLNGKRIELGRETIYFQVFDILIKHQNQDGFVSYETIEDQLVQTYRKERSKSPEDRSKRIRHALSSGQGFFRFARINGRKIKNKLPNGKPLIEVMRGKGLRLSNRPV
jgi:hypothetical protein